MAKNPSNPIIKKVQKIGVLDSGRGGLTVLKSLIDAIPAEYYYLADIKNLPYGAKSPEKLLELTINNINFLRTYNIQIIIIACHTLSATVLLKLKKYFSDLIFIDVLQPTVEAALSITKNKKIGIMATMATIKSHAHKKALLQKDNTLTVTEQECPTLASMIEELPLNHSNIIACIEEYSKIFNHAKIDTLILGCTHYGLIKDLISQYTPAYIISAENIIVDFIKKNYSIIPTLQIRTLNIFQTSTNPLFEKAINEFLLPFKTKKYFLKTFALISVAK
jgi:glutamate racemase